MAEPTPPPTENLSEEEIKLRMEKREAYLDGRLPLLRKEKEFAELQFQVDNFFYNRRLVLRNLAEMDAPPEPDKK